MQIKSLEQTAIMTTGKMLRYLIVLCYVTLYVLL